LLSPDDKKKYFRRYRRKRVTQRTVQRAARALKQLNIIYKKGRYFSLSPNAFTEVRYFSDDFAAPALSSITYFPLKTIEQSLEELVVRYGSLIIFVFIEAARPINYTSPSGDIDKKKLFDSWLQNALPIREMFDYFFSLYRGRNNNSDTDLSDEL
jgi:hypothetical protein